MSRGLVVRWAGLFLLLVGFSNTTLGLPRLQVERRWDLDPADFSEPVALAAGPHGDVYVADLGRGTVVHLDSTGHADFTFETPDGQPDLQPLDVAVTGFQVYVLDAVSNRLLRFSDAGGWLDVLRNFADEGIETPRSLDVDGTGRVVLALTSTHRVRVLDELQQLETEVGSFGERAGEFRDPRAVAFESDGAFWVADAGNRRVQRYTAVGNLDTSWTWPRGEPRGLVVGPGGLLFAADPAAGGVRLRDASGQERTVDLAPARPVDVTVRGRSLWVLSAHPPRLHRLRILREE